MPKLIGREVVVRPLIDLVSNKHYFRRGVIIDEGVQMGVRKCQVVLETRGKERECMVRWLPIKALCLRERVSPRFIESGRIWGNDDAKNRINKTNPKEK
jgi:hypothetical protein